MNKQKKLNNQKRQQRREAKKRIRHKRPRIIRKPKLQSYQPQQTVSLQKRAIRYLTIIRNKTMCFIGRHKWTLCSAPEGKPKYWCRRCGEYSKKLW